MIHLLPLLPLLLLVPPTLMWRTDKRLHRAAIDEIRRCPINTTEFPALEAWRAHNRRQTWLSLTAVAASMLLSSLIQYLILRP